MSNLEQKCPIDIEEQKTTLFGTYLYDHLTRATIEPDVDPISPG